jgi:hypothetical protein
VDDIISLSLLEEKLPHSTLTPFLPLLLSGAIRRRYILWECAAPIAASHKCERVSGKVAMSLPQPLLPSATDAEISFDRIPLIDSHVMAATIGISADFQNPAVQHCSADSQADIESQPVLSVS